MQSLIMFFMENKQSPTLNFCISLSCDMAYIESGIYMLIPLFKLIFSFCLTVNNTDSGDYYLISVTQ